MGIDNQRFTSSFILSTSCSIASTSSVISLCDVADGVTSTVGAGATTMSSVTNLAVFEEGTVSTLKNRHKP